MVVALAAVVGMTCSAVAVAVAPAAARTVHIPRISATPSIVRPDDSTTVGAYDLAPLTEYQVQVCGNAGFGSSAECNLAATTTAATSETGHFVVVLTVVRPPVPCPCVIKATPLKGTNGLAQAEISTPITILGAPTATVVPPPVNGTPSGLVVDRADLVGTKSWAEWFGDSAHRTLVLRLRDAGPNLIPSTPFVLRSGPAGHPTQVVGAPFVPPLRPGQVVSYRVPVTFPPLAHGDYVVVGRLGNAGQIVTFTAKTPLMPWGLVILVAMVVLVALGLLVGRILRRREGPSGDDTAVGTPTGDPAAAATGPPNFIGDPTGPPPVAAMSSSDPESPGTL